METKIRIRTIRLMEMLQKNPAYAQTLGVEAALTKAPAETT